MTQDKQGGGRKDNHMHVKSEGKMNSKKIKEKTKNRI